MAASLPPGGLPMTLRAPTRRSREPQRRGTSTGGPEIVGEVRGLGGDEVVLESEVGLVEVVEVGCAVVASVVVACAVPPAPSIGGKLGW